MEKTKRLGENDSPSGVKGALVETMGNGLTCCGMPIPTNELFKKPYLNEKEVAELTGKAVSTLRNERFLRKGIPYLKIGRSIRYRFPDTINYMEARLITFDQK